MVNTFPDTKEFIDKIVEEIFLEEKVAVAQVFLFVLVLLTVTLIFCY